MYVNKTALRSPYTSLECKLWIIFRCHTLLFPSLTIYIFLHSTHINPKWTSYHGVQPEPSEVMFDLIFLTIMRELRGLKLKKPVHKDVACVFHIGALPLHCGLLWTEPDQTFAWILSNVSPGQEELWSVLHRVSPHIRFEANIANLEANIFKRTGKLKG